MSLEGLRKFNEGYGYPLHRSPEDSKLPHIFAKILAAIPFAGVCSIGPRESPALFSRIILASTIVGLPIIFALDIIATLFTQPIGRALEKHRARHLALAEM